MTDLDDGELEEAALRAMEEAGMRGLCRDGQIEVAVGEVWGPSGRIRSIWCCST
ncbi:MAG: hypothetical protein H7841_15880 [Magnetospirillum sp. WYHS-4]